MPSLKQIQSPCLKQAQAVTDLLREIEETEFLFGSIDDLVIFYIPQEDFKDQQAFCIYHKDTLMFHVLGVPTDGVRRWTLDKSTYAARETVLENLDFQKRPFVLSFSYYGIKLDLIGAPLGEELTLDQITPHWHGLARIKDCTGAKSVFWGQELFALLGGIAKHKRISDMQKSDPRSFLFGV